MTSVALRVDPHAEVEAIHLVGQRDAGVTAPFDVVQEPAETLLVDGQARLVVSSCQLMPSSTISREARVKAMTPTAAKLSPRWLQ